MSNIEALEKAVVSLSPKELNEFRHWFAEYEATRWDEKIETDAAAGKLDAMAEEALREFRQGKSVEL